MSSTCIECTKDAIAKIDVTGITSTACGHSRRPVISRVIEERDIVILHTSEVFDRQTSPVSGR